MKTTVALLCLGLALASRPPSDIEEYQPRNAHEETSYVPGKLYQYYYDSQLLHGIPKASSQRSGQRIQAIVNAYAESATKMAIQLKSVSIGSINQRLHQDAESRILRTDAFEQAEINEEQKRQLESPVVFKREHGLISALEYAQNEPEWSLNIKRSILSLMSHNLEAHAAQTPKELYCPKSGECSRPAQQRLEDMRYYQTYETSVEGNCETDYVLVQNPSGMEESVWNVSKTINLGKCQQAHGSINSRPEIRYNFHLSDACPECDFKGKMLNSSTLVTVDVIGERKNFVIEKAQSVSEYYIPDLSDNEKVTYRAKVNQSLRLIEVSQKDAPVLQSSASQFGNTLMYSLDWDSMKEKFFMEGTPDFLAQSPYSKFLSDPVTVVLQLLKELTREMAASIPDKAVDNNAPSTFLRLVRVMRLLKEADFDKIHSEVFQSGLGGVSPKDQKAAKDLVHTAIGAAGTYPALKHISKCISENKITQNQAVNAIRQFQNARVVNSKALAELKQLCGQVGTDKPALKQALLLTYGSLARTFCMPRNNKLALGQPSGTVRSAHHSWQCSSQERQQIVQFIVDQINEDTDKWADQVLALKALRNAGLPEALPEIRKLVENRQLSEIVRANAIMSLEHLKSSIPKQVISVCMPIVLDRQMEPSLRMAAVHMIMKCDPSMSEMAQLAAQVNRKQDSRPVKSFIYTYLSSLANSTSSPCDMKKSEKARQVLRLVRDDEKVITGSFASLSAFFNKEHQSNYGMINEVFSVMSNQSFLPTFASWQSTWKMMGLQDSVDLVYGGEGVDKAIVKMLTEYWNEPAQSRARRSLSDSIQQKLSDLTANYETFDVESSKLLLYLRVMGQDVGFLPLDKPIFEWLRSLSTKDTLKSLGQNINYNWASIMSETMYKIPSAMGLPLVIRRQVPVVAQIKGSIGDIEDPQYYIKNANIMPTLAEKIEVTAEVWSPIVNSGLKVRELMRASLPIKGSVKKNGEIEMELPSRAGREIFSAASEPLCFVRKWYAAEPNTYVKPQSQPVVSEQHSRISKKEMRSTNIMGMEVEYRQWAHPSTEQSWSYPMVMPLYGPNVHRLVVRKAASSSCEKMLLKLNKPTFSWESTEESINIQNFKVSESGSSEEASWESQDYSASAKSPFYVAKWNLEAQCSDKKTIQLKYVESADSRMRKIAAKLQSGSKQQCLQGEVLYPVTPMTPEETTGKTYSRLVYSWAGQCSGNNPADRVQIAIQSEKSKAKAEMERQYQQQHKQCLLEESAVPCYYIVKEAAKPNKHTVQIKYDPSMPVYYKNATQKLLSYFVSEHIRNTDINKYEKSHANEINAIIRVDPRTTSRVNVTIKEPGQTIHMKDINSCLFNWETAMLSQALKPTSYSAMCTVADSHVETFDKTKFSAPITNCWSVLAKDCSKQNRFAVLMKRNTMGSLQKTLAVVTKSQRVEVSDSLAVSVNGQQKQLNDDITKLSDDLIVQRYASQKIKISLPKQRVVVYFDGQAAKVSVNAMYFTEQCGLCGHYNRDAMDVLRSPLSQQQTSILDFFKQYQIEIEGCQKEPEQPTEYTYNHQFSTKSQNRRQPRETSPISGYIGHHIDGEYCVCKEKKPICPKGYSPSDYQKERVTLHCISDRFESRQIARQIANYATEIQLPTEFEDSTTVTVQIPSKCKRH